MTSAFPRFHLLPSVSQRLARDFQRLTAVREGRTGKGLTPVDEGVLDMYEFAVKHAFEEVGKQAELIFKDVGDILGVESDLVQGYFDYLQGELGEITTRNVEEPMVIRLNLGEIIEQQVAETCKDHISPIKNAQICTNLTAISIISQLPPTKEAIFPSSESFSASEDSTCDAISPFSGLYQMLIPTPTGAFISVLTVNMGNWERFPEKWEFLLKNEVCFPIPYMALGSEKSCKCRFEYCCSDYCPCTGQYPINITLNGSKLLINLPNIGYFHLKACTSACHCLKSACSLYLLTHNFKQSRTVLTCVGANHWTLFSFDPIPAWEFVMEVTGEVIGEAEHIGKQGFFDPLLCFEPALYLKTREKGSLARFLTHSCEGNLSVLRVTPGSTWLETRLLLFSNRAISSKEELTVNFDQLLNLPFSIRCECGSQTCRGQIGPVNV